MKQKIEKKPITLSGDVELGDVFKIQESAHAFKVLFESLYSDKILAVVRETLCNALDVSTHRVPDVTLPSSEDSNYYCKDYGPGLSHSDLMNLYTTVFYSTKTTDKDTIGGFGLGSKAPFAYTKGFAVTSVFDDPSGRMQRTYSLFLDEVGCPRPVLLQEARVADDLPTGLEVVVPVNPNDFSSFYNTLRDLLVYLPKEERPQVYGANVEIKEAFYTGKYPACAYTKLDRYEYSSHRVVMGGISYPVKMRSIDRGSVKGSNILGAITSMNTTLFLDVGEVELVPSREALSYTKATQSVLIQKYWELINHIIKDLEEYLQTYTSVWAGAVALQQKITQCMEIAALRDKNLLPLGLRKYLSLERKNPHTSLHSKGVLVNQRIKWILADSIQPSKNINVCNHWIYLDKPNTQPKVSKYLKYQSHTGKRSVARVFETEDGAKLCMEHYGVPVSLLEAASKLQVPKEKKLPPKHLNDFIRTVDKSYCCRANSWVTLPVDPSFAFEGGGYYVNLKNNKIIVGDNKYNYGVLQSLLRALKIPLNSVYGVTSVAKQRKFHKAPQWVEFFSYAKELSSKRLTSSFLSAYSSRSRGTEAELNIIYDYYLQGDYSPPPTSILTALLTQEAGKVEMSEDHKTTVELCSILRIPIPARDVIPKVTWKTLCTKFPLLKFVTLWGLESNVKDCLDYIKLLEAREELCNTVKHKTEL